MTAKGSRYKIREESAAGTLESFSRGAALRRLCLSPPPPSLLLIAPPARDAVRRNYRTFGSRNVNTLLGSRVASGKGAFERTEKTRTPTLLRIYYSSRIAVTGLSTYQRSPSTTTRVRRSRRLDSRLIGDPRETERARASGRKIALARRAKRKTAGFRARRRATSRTPREESETLAKDRSDDRPPFARNAETEVSYGGRLDAAASSRLASRRRA